MVDYRINEEELRAIHKQGIQIGLNNISEKDWNLEYFLKSKTPIKELNRENVEEICAKIYNQGYLNAGLSAEKQLENTDKTGTDFQLAIDQILALVPDKPVTEYINNPVVYCDDLDCDNCIINTCKYEGEIEIINGRCQSKTVNDEIVDDKPLNRENVEKILAEQLVATDKDLNNLLHTVLGKAIDQILDLVPDKPVDKNIKEIREAVVRGLEKCNEGFDEWLEKIGDNPANKDIDNYTANFIIVELSKLNQDKVIARGEVYYVEGKDFDVCYVGKLNVMDLLFKKARGKHIKISVKE